jgi:hypothetical protein
MKPVQQTRFPVKGKLTVVRPATDADAALLALGATGADALSTHRTWFAERTRFVSYR